MNSFQQSSSGPNAAVDFLGRGSPPVATLPLEIRGEVSLARAAARAASSSAFFLARSSSSIFFRLASSSAFSRSSHSHVVFFVDDARRAEMLADDNRSVEGLFTGVVTEEGVEEEPALVGVPLEGPGLWATDFLCFILALAT